MRFRAVFEVWEIERLVLIPDAIPFWQGVKVCDVNSALFLLKATKEFKEKSTTLARALAERMGLPGSMLALPWDVPVYRSGRMEWDLAGIRSSPPKQRVLLFLLRFNLRLDPQILAG
jgi:hypothetical protein